MNRQRIQGFSLIELMIAIALGALILAGTVVLFQQSRSSSHQDEQIARMQENGRFALRALTRELAMVGYWGGMLDAAAISTAAAAAGTDCTAGGWMLDLDPSIEFTDNATASPYSACISDAEILDDTDVLGIKRVADLPAMEVDNGGNKTGAVVPNAIYLKTNTVLGELYDANNAADDGPAGVPVPNSQLRYMPAVLYIRPWSVTNGDGIPALVRETLEADDMNAQLIVDGIENLQLEWGIDGADTNLAPDYYVAAPTAAELADAVTARVYVLVRSPSQVAGYVNDKTYTLGAEVLGPYNDAYYRRMYTSTVQLRNADKLKLYALN